MWSRRVAQDAPTSTSAKVNEKLGSKIISSRQKSLRTFCIREAYELRKKKNYEYNATFNIKLHVCFLYTLWLLAYSRIMYKYRKQRNSGQLDLRMTC